jgi:hypothetical protein
VADLILDESFRERLIVDGDDFTNVVVADWNDRMGDVYDGLEDDLGLPATLIVQAGHDGPLLYFYITSSPQIGAVGDDAYAYDSEESLGDFLVTVIRNGCATLYTPAVAPSSPTSGDQLLSFKFARAA